MISAALAVLENEEQRNELAEFYEKNKNRFYAIAYKYLHNKEEAEDAVQEAFLRIANKPDRFFSLNDDKQVFYVFAVVRNVSIDMFNKSTEIIADELSKDIVYQNDFSSLEGFLLDKLSHDEILSFINNLPPLQYSVLVLTCLLGLSISETAQTLKISEDSVSQRLHLARKSIRAFIEERNKSYE